MGMNDTTAGGGHHGGQCAIAAIGHRDDTDFQEWIGRGARILGGCCGLTVEHIEAAWQAAKNA